IGVREPWIAGKLSGREVRTDAVERLLERLKMCDLPGHQEGEGVFHAWVVCEVDQSLVDDFCSRLCCDVGTQICGWFANCVYVARVPELAPRVREGRPATVQNLCNMRIIA